VLATEKALGKKPPGERGLGGEREASWVASTSKRGRRKTLKVVQEIGGAGLPWTGGLRNRRRTFEGKRTELKKEKKKKTNAVVKAERQLVVDVSGGAKAVRSRKTGLGGKSAVRSD